MAAADLFTWLDALWNKSQPEGTFPGFMAHRFLASDRDLAEACRVLGREVREPTLLFRTWQGMLPKGKGAPRLQYVVAKKAPEEEALVTRMKAHLAESRTSIESMIEIVRAAGRLPQLYAEFGIAPPE